MTADLQEIYEDLNRFASNDYSQWGEDGVLAELFERIGTANKWCLECGASDGLFFSNTRKLIEAGWTGILIEADADLCQRLSTNSAGLSAHVFNVKIDAENKLDDILTSVSAPKDIDLVVIDIDGQDFYAFNAMLKFKPRFVLIEYGQGYDPDFLPTRGGAGQAGLHRITGLAAGKGYAPVWRSPDNLLVVRQPLELEL